jgi:hypothetical protein
MRQVPLRVAALLALLVLLVVAPSRAAAHRDGCHAAHSCPSDAIAAPTYTCGDTGHCSECPDNQYCLNYEPRGAAYPSPSATPAPPPPLALSISTALNRDTVTLNEHLALSLQLVNTGGAGVVTLYVVIVLPASASPAFGCETSGVLVFLANNGTTFEVLCGSAPPDTFPAYTESLPISAGAYLTFTDVLSLLWPAGAPTGVYTFAALATPVGGLDDGTIDPEDFTALGVELLVAQ